MKYSLSKQIKYLKHDKGINFNVMTENEAKEILSSVTYYYKVTCYRKNFRKDQFGKYTDIDFALLNDLAIIDMRLRYVLIQIGLDLEHALKASLIRSITNSSEDGYKIVNEFDAHEENIFNSNNRNPRRVYKSVEKMIIGKIGNQQDYDFSLTNVYSPSLRTPRPTPIWVLLEKMSYGNLNKFINFYVIEKKANYKYFKSANDLLIMTKRIRDAAAHSRPILMNIGNSGHAGIISNRISNLVETKFQQLDIAQKSTTEYSGYMDLLKNIKIHDLFCLIVLHSEYIKSPAVKSIRKKELKKVLSRAHFKKTIYAEHKNLKEVYNLFNKVINNI